jgi:hypothetical protein
MRVQVVNGDVRSSSQSLQDALNDWLEVCEDTIHIEHTQVIGPDVETCKYQLLIFYTELGDKLAEPHEPVPEGKRCSQCKKRAALVGTKHCAECKAYQKKYREERKAEKNTRYP